MDGLKQWALCMIIASAAGAFVMIVSPRGSMDKTVRAVTGIFVVASMCTPLVNAFESDDGISVPAYFDFEEDDIAVNNGDYVIDAFANEVKSVITAALSKLDAKPEEIYMDMYIDGENCIIIQEITVTVNEEVLRTYKDLSLALGDILGFPVTVNAG